MWIMGINGGFLVVATICRVCFIANVNLGNLPVLFSTSTLSVGVNLPAHLVIIKSTDCYNNGVIAPAPISQIIQMIGRAGRPQFDTHAKAVVMVKNQDRDKYSKCLQGQQTIESSLHMGILEHLNTEINLRTVKCRSSALLWMKSTFLYVRVQKDPKAYCLKVQPGCNESIEHFLTNIVATNFACLERLELVQRNNPVKRNQISDEAFSTTTLGSIMAVKALKFKTMELLLSLSGNESIHQLVLCVAKVEDLNGTVLRVEEKRSLNALLIRIPYKTHITKVKTASDKIAVLIHATLASVIISEFNIQQDVNLIFKILPRIGSALVQILEYKQYFVTLKNAYLFLQSIRTRMWHNSKLVSRQVERIGLNSAQLLAKAGFTTFASIKKADPRNLEVILKRHAPFGDKFIDYVKHIPEVSLKLNQIMSASSELSVEVVLTLDNLDLISQKSNSLPWHRFAVIVGTCQNELLFEAKISEKFLKISGSWSRTVAVPTGKSILASCISSAWCGVGATCSIKKVDFNELPESSNPFVLLPKLLGSQVSKSGNGEKSLSTSSSQRSSQSCKHSCKDKSACAHSCCKVGFGSAKPLINSKTASQNANGYNTAVDSDVLEVIDVTDSGTARSLPQQAITGTQISAPGNEIMNRTTDVMSLPVPGPSILKKKLSQIPVTSSGGSIDEVLVTPLLPKEVINGSSENSIYPPKANREKDATEQRPAKKFTFKKRRSDKNAKLLECNDANKLTSLERDESTISTPIKRKQTIETKSQSGPSPSKRVLFDTGISSSSLTKKFSSIEPVNPMTSSNAHDEKFSDENSARNSRNDNDLIDKVIAEELIDDSSISYSPLEYDTEDDNAYKAQIERPTVDSGIKRSSILHDFEVPNKDFDDDDCFVIDVQQMESEQNNPPYVRTSQLLPEAAVASSGAKSCRNEINVEMQHRESSTPVRSLKNRARDMNLDVSSPDFSDKASTGNDNIRSENGKIVTNQYSVTNRYQELGVKCARSDDDFQESELADSIRLALRGGTYSEENCDNPNAVNQCFKAKEQDAFGSSAEKSEKRKVTSDQDYDYEILDIYRIAYEMYFK